jgi:PAS domain S-box-containing protein
MAKTLTIPDSASPDFRNIFESVPGMCVVLDPQFTVVNASNAYLQTTGTRREQIIGKYLFDILPASMDAAYLTRLEASLQNTISSAATQSMDICKYDIRHNKPAGDAPAERYWNVHNAPVMGSNGNVGYIIHCIMDVTDFVNLRHTHTKNSKRTEDISGELDSTSKELAQSRVFLKNIMNTVVDPIFVKDRHHRWIEGNDALWELFGRSEDELIGKSDYDFFPKEEADVFWQKDEEVFNSGKVNVNVENFTDSHGKKHIISTKKACFTAPDGEKILVGVIRDITEMQEMTAKLRESDEARLKAIMDHSGCVVYIKDVDGKYIRANKDLLELMGRPEHDVVGKTDHDFFPPQYADVFRTNDLQVIENASAMEFEEAAPHKDGVHTYRSVKFPLFDANNTLYAVCGLSTDVTERKQTEDAAAFLASIVTSSDDAVISRTLDNIITSWNTGAERLFGYSEAEAVGASINIIIPPEREGEETKLLQQIQGGKPAKGLETLRMNKAKHTMHVSLTESPIFDADDKMIGVSMVARDISQRKQVEAQLLHYTWELERSNQELDDFAYIASHDLKEPLRGVFNHASFLLEDYGDKLDEDAVHRLNRLSSLAQRMEHLINDLLYFSRLGRTELAIRETDPNEVVKEIRHMLDGVLQEFNARITINGTMPMIVCDKPRITEVFRNLITNAIKYNDKHERLVEVGWLPEIAGPAGMEANIFYVKDNGVGIDPEFHNEIFRIFKRLSKPANEQEAGTGVGLTFVKKIIERHNGHIWLASEPGKGSVFYFTIGKK